MIEVTNENDFVHRDRYNGIDFTFPPGKPVQIDIDAAKLMFGYGVADKTGTLVRNGWLTGTATEAHAKEILGNFIFRDADMYVAPVEATDGTEQQSALLQPGSEEEGSDGLGPSLPPRGRGGPRRASL